MKAPSPMEHRALEEIPPVNVLDEKAIEYALTIESWDDLVDPRTLAFYNLGPDPSSYVLRTLSIEEKKREKKNGEIRNSQQITKKRKKERK